MTFDFLPFDGLKKLQIRFSFCEALDEQGGFAGVVVAPSL
jgi:hypothetical protein